MGVYAGRQLRPQRRAARARGGYVRVDSLLRVLLPALPGAVRGVPELRAADGTGVKTVIFLSFCVVASPAPSFLPAFGAWKSDAKDGRKGRGGVVVDVGGGSRHWFWHSHVESRRGSAHSLSHGFCVLWGRLDGTSLLLLWAVHYRDAR